MKIIWNPNPLCTVVELDDSDRRWLRERLNAENLQERICSAHFTLDPEQRKWRAEHTKQGPKTLEECIAEAMRDLDVSFILGDSDHNGKTYDAWLDERLVMAVQALSESHGGDCTCSCCSCFKCHIEELLGLDTIAGLGKHEASNIGGAFSDDGTTTLDEAIEKLRDHVPVRGPEWEAFSQEDFDRHVPRWTEEGRRALAWLCEYKAKHFAGGRP